MIPGTYCLEILCTFCFSEDCRSALLKQVASQGNDGETPLHLAASSGHVSLAEILLDHGAAINVTLKRRDAAWTR